MSCKPPIEELRRVSLKRRASVALSAGNGFFRVLRDIAIGRGRCHTSTRWIMGIRLSILFPRSQHFS